MHTSNFVTNFYFDCGQNPFSKMPFHFFFPFFLVNNGDPNGNSSNNIVAISSSPHSIAIGLSIVEKRDSLKFWNLAFSPELSHMYEKHTLSDAHTNTFTNQLSGQKVSVRFLIAFLGLICNPWQIAIQYS